VPKGVLEIVAPIKLVDAFGLQHGDAIRIDLIAREDAAVVT
jgi:CTP-dependent riboflavin kinase